MARSLEGNTLQAPNLLGDLAKNHPRLVAWLDPVTPFNLTFRAKGVNPKGSVFNVVAWSIISFSEFFPWRR